ncbi:MULTISPECIES: YbaB/EbfC family nucleoid-associated protein [unclassified Streptosporangium]|uniref:YbaB/EbfC family nucleoid-associated protein n=1 Tax=unclassified Streptosporangium TaxID=2632669 RepID=UPI002E2AE505|nr:MULTISPECIES: YbaB/EbfC family nucleoid-associated protein [unclassified Streptosporangium]
MLDELTAEYEQQARRVKDAYGTLADLEVTARSDDGMVTVKAGPRGEVRAIELNPRVYRKLSPAELSHAIMTQIDRATAAVAARTKELMGPLVPDDVPVEELLGKGAVLEPFVSRAGRA